MSFWCPYYYFLVYQMTTIAFSTCELVFVSLDNPFTAKKTKKKTGSDSVRSNA